MICVSNLWVPNSLPTSLPLNPIMARELNHWIKMTIWSFQSIDFIKSIWAYTQPFLRPSIISWALLSFFTIPSSPCCVRCWRRLSVCVDSWTTSFRRTEARLMMFMLSPRFPARARKCTESSRSICWNEGMLKAVWIRVQAGEKQHTGV